MFSSISKGVLRRPSQDKKPVIFGAEELEGTALQEGYSQELAQKPQPAYTLTDKHMKSRESDVSQPSSTKEHGGVPAKTGERQSMSTGGTSPAILSIGGGKGGIGKSFVSANVAVCLAQKGYRVALVDLDLGAANLHTCLGVQSPKHGLFDFLTNKIENFEEIGVPTATPGLTLYAGGQEFWQQVRPHSVQKIKLISKLQKLPADYVILDLGAGTHVNTLDFFIFSHAGILVVVPEPTSIENAYVFLKSVLYRKLQSIAKAVRHESATEGLLAALADPKITMPPFAQLQKFANEQPQLGQKIIQLIQMTQIGIVMNQVRSPADADIGQSMVQICNRYFGFQAQSLGAAGYDDAVWKSVRNRKVLCAESSQSLVAGHLLEIANNISDSFAPLTKFRNAGV